MHVIKVSNEESTTGLITITGRPILLLFNNIVVIVDSHLSLASSLTLATIYLEFGSTIAFACGFTFAFNLQWRSALHCELEYRIPLSLPCPCPLCPFRPTLCNPCIVSNYAPISSKFMIVGSKEKLQGIQEVE